MSAAELNVNGRHYGSLYMWSLVTSGTAIVLISLYELPFSDLDQRFLFLCLMVSASSLVAIRIPSVSGRITVADTLIFLTLLLYGGPAAILVSALEGVAATLIISKRIRTVLFNTAILATSTFLTAAILDWTVGSPVDVIAGGFSNRFIYAVVVMGLVQYIANTSLVALEMAHKIKESTWNTWRTYYLWTSVTYFAGASAAGIIAILIRTYGFYAVVATVPIVIIVCFTYQTYLENIEASAARTEAARSHVEELSRYVSELQRSEEARAQLLERAQRARAEAEAANRIKDEFLATLSHELRTPLTSLLAWASVLREATNEPALLIEGVEAIDRNARVQAQLIDDLLDVSRIVSGKLHLDVRPLNISSVTRAAIDVVRPAADAKSILLEFVAEPGLGAISADSARLHQVIWNLLSNAVKFTPEGGKIGVYVKQDGSQARVTVRDTGLGIHQEFLPRVFDRFRQADSSTTRTFGGLGLGLAVVRHLVELHGGTVSAESEGIGKGATFSVTFPLVTDRREPGNPTQTGEVISPSVRSLVGLRVLLIDDEPEARSIIGRLIGRAGAEIKTCSSASEGLIELVEWRPNVILSDIAMPEEDGYSFISKVRSLPNEKGGETPAAALTAYAREEDRAHALAAGYQMHISKPIDASHLLNMVARLAGHAKSPVGTIVD
ncbi:MAG TPA: ATP-binding protein [Pyrinomonadaceae bacterium]|nr:ATP-binding protein [Pyrinomonadaceae bacterium]